MNCTPLKMPSQSVTPSQPLCNMGLNVTDFFMLPFLSVTKHLTTPHRKRQYATACHRKHKQHWFSDQKLQADTPPTRRFFIVTYSRMVSSFGGLCGKPSGLPIPVLGSLTRIVPPPRLATRGGLTQTVQEIQPC